MGKSPLENWINNVLCPLLMRSILFTPRHKLSLTQALQGGVFQLSFVCSIWPQKQTFSREMTHVKQHLKSFV